MGPPKTAIFTNTNAGKVKVNFGSLMQSSTTSVSFAVKNYSAHVINCVPNNITEHASVDVSSYTAIRGCKSSATALNLNIPHDSSTTFFKIAELREKWC